METNIWKIEKDLCRCCHKEGSFRNLAEPCIEMGEEEVYCDMLKDSFDIDLIPVPGNLSAPTYTICESCINRLREAAFFKQQVLACEKNFREMYSNNFIIAAATPIFLDVKQEPEPDDDDRSIKMEEDVSDQMQDSNDDDGIFHDDAGHNDEGEKQSDNINRGKELKELTIPSKTIREEKTVAEDLESDVSLAKMSTVNIISGKNSKCEAVEGVKDYEIPRDIVQKEFCEKIQGESGASVLIESRIDNNKLRSNIALILKNSTIIPFRHLYKQEFVCLYCEKKFLLFIELKEHVDIAHGDITESQIKKNLKNPKDLTKVDISDVRCKLCIAPNRIERNGNVANNGTQNKYETIESLVNHLVNVHKKMYIHISSLTPSHGLLAFDLSTDDIKCHLCHKRFSFFKCLSIHMNEHYSYYNCGKCKKKFVSETRLKNHINKHKNGGVICKLCEKEFKTIAKRETHMRQVHRTVNFKCFICHEVFSQDHLRQRHYVEKHNIKKPEFKCDLCFKQLATTSSLRRHMKYMHLKNSECTCDYCGKSFGSKASIEQHLSLHTGVKKFVCKYCHKKFRLSSTLKVHVRGHLNVKPHACSLCDAAFIQKHCLTSHIRVHHPGASMESGKP